MGTCRWPISWMAASSEIEICSRLIEKLEIIDEDVDYNSVSTFCDDITLFASSEDGLVELMYRLERNNQNGS